MTRPIVVELTDEQILERYKDNTFRTVHSRTNPIPSTYAGKYAILAAIAVNEEATEAQLDALQVAIEAINPTLIHKAFVLVGASRIPTDKVGVDEDLFIEVTANFNVEGSLL